MPDSLKNSRTYSLLLTDSAVLQTALLEQINGGSVFGKLTCSAYQTCASRFSLRAARPEKEEHVQDSAGFLEATEMHYLYEVG